MTRYSAFSIGFSLFVLLSTPVWGGPAINQFEVKDLEAEPGELEFQSQNAHSWGQPKRRFIEAEPGEYIFDDNSIIHQRHALELEFSMSRHFRMRVGIEFEKERLEDPEDLALANEFDELKLEEIAGEGVFIFKRVPESGGLGLGMLVELQYPLENGEPKSVVAGPIVQITQGQWNLVANLTAVKFFGGREIDEDGEIEQDDKVDLAYAGQLLYSVSDKVTLGMEAYGTFERIAGSGTKGEEAIAFGDVDQHRAGPIVYYSFGLGRSIKQLGVTSIKEDDEESDEPEESVATLGVGLFFGLNDDTPDATLKWSLEVEF